MHNVGNLNKVYIMMHGQKNFKFSLAFSSVRISRVKWLLQTDVPIFCLLLDSYSKLFVVYKRIYTHLHLVFVFPGESRLCLLASLTVTKIVEEG